MIKSILSALTILPLVCAVLTADDSPQAEHRHGQSRGHNHNTENNSGDLAPDKLGGKTIDGQIGGTLTTWQLVFSNTGNTGTYIYLENGRQLDSGTWTYTKTSENTGTLALGDGTIVQFTWTGSNAGNYVVPAAGVAGPFTNT